MTLKNKIEQFKNRQTKINQIVQFLDSYVPADPRYYDLLEFEWHGDKYYLPVPILRKEIARMMANSVPGYYNKSWNDMLRADYAIEEIKKNLPVEPRTEDFFTDCYGEPSYFACTDPETEAEYENLKRRHRVTNRLARIIAKAIVEGKPVPSTYTNFRYIEG